MTTRRKKTPPADDNNTPPPIDLDAIQDKTQPASFDEWCAQQDIEFLCGCQTDFSELPDCIWPHC